MKIAKKLSKFLTISLLVYMGICFALIYWPVPAKKNIENYDYSSLNESGLQTNMGSEQWIKLRDGKELFFRLYESNSNATLILLHGSGTESRYLSQVASFLSSRNIMRVITPDLRGHGRNKGHKGDIDYIGQLDHDIEDLLIHVEENYRGTKVVLGGHSSGGGMALRYVGNESVLQPNALLLFAPYLGHESPTVKPNSGEWVTVALKRWIGLAMINNLGITALNDLPVLVFNRPESWNDNLQVASYSYRMAVNFAPNNYADDISKIKIPTLVLIGENDESFYPEKFDEVFETSKNSVDVHIVKNANHMNIIDTHDSNSRVINWYNNSIQSIVNAPAD
jgi:non-heme chloroperoxidase